MSAPSSSVQLNNPTAASALQAYGSRTVNRLVPAEHSWSAAEAAAASATAVHAAAACSATADQTITTAITSPPCARSIIATTSGTSGDVKAVQVVITGTDIDGNEITESLPAFTVNTNETVTGSKAFATVTSYLVPAMDGTGCSVSIGFGDKLGLPYKFARNPVLRTFLGTTLEGTAATVAVSSSALANNTVDLNSALNGTAVTVEMLVPGA